MKGLTGLIRLHRLRLDEQRRELARIETTRDQLLGQIRHLEERLAAEGRTVGEAAETGLTLGSFVQASIERRRLLDRSVADVEERIGAVREEVAAAFRELKRFELAEELRRRRAATAERRREQSREDEIGINIYRRRQPPARR